MGLNYDEFLKELEYKNLRKTIVDLKTKIKHLEAKIKKQDEEKESHIKYLEDEYRLNNDEWKDAKSRDDEMFYFGKLKEISSILERLKSGKYES